MYKPFLLAGSVVLALSFRERRKQQRHQHVSHALPGLQPVTKAQVDPDITRVNAYASPQKPALTYAVPDSQQPFSAAQQRSPPHVRLLPVVLLQLLLYVALVVWAANYYPALTLVIAGGCSVMFAAYLLVAVQLDQAVEVEVTSEQSPALVEQVEVPQPEPEPVPLQDLTGTWIKDREASDSMEDAMDVAQLNGFVRMAVRRIKGMQIVHTADEFKLVILSGILGFKVVERYPMSGDSRRYKRRDLRRGQHTGHVKATREGRLQVHLIWGEPLGGLGCDEFSCPEPGVLHVSSCLVIHGRQARYVTVYRLQQ